MERIGITRLALLGAALLCCLASGPVDLAAGETADPASKANLDLPASVDRPEGEDEEIAPEVIVFYGQQYEADTFVFCCDKSGSMNEGGKFQRLQREVVKNISQFSEHVQFAIVFFDSQLMKFPASGKPARATPSMKAAGIAWVLSARPGSMTCSKPALLTAIDFANRSDARRKAIIYLSDGLNVCPGHEPASYDEEILTEVRRRNVERVRINTIALGSPAGARGGAEIGEQWMRELAAQNRGTFTRVD